MQRSRWWALAGLSLALMSCTDEVDKAAKRRIFSPEDPPKVVASSSEKLAVDRLGEDGRLGRRVLDMSAAEVTERLGPHKFSATVKFEWSGGEQSVDLLENRTLLAGPGGVNGDFHATVQNSRDQGLEVIRVNGAVYARGRYGKFRQRLRDRGMAEREREEVFGALRDFDSLFKGRLKLEPTGTTTYEGRTVWKYAVGLASAAAGEGQGPVLPERAQSKGGVDATTQRRQFFFDKHEPTELSGEVLVDSQTAVVLEAKLDGKLSVPATDKEKAARVRLTLDSSLTGLGSNPGVKAPQEFLADADKPEGIAATLDRFGVPRGGVDAGTPPAKGSRSAPGKGDEPEDEAP